MEDWNQKLRRKRVRAAFQAFTMEHYEKDVTEPRKTTQKQMKFVRVGQSKLPQNNWNGSKQSVYVPLKIPIVGLIALCKIKILCNLEFRGFDKLVEKGCLSVYCRSMSID